MMLALAPERVRRDEQCSVLAGGPERGQRVAVTSARQLQHPPGLVEQQVSRRLGFGPQHALGVA